MSYFKRGLTPGPKMQSTHNMAICHHRLSQNVIKTISGWVSVPYWHIAAQPCVKAGCTGESPLILFSTDVTRCFLASCPSSALSLQDCFMAVLLMIGAVQSDQLEEGFD